MFGLTRAANGHLYGTTYYGGTYNLGVVFKMDLPPTAQGGPFSTDEDTAGVGLLTASDFEGDPLTFSIVAQGTKGSVLITNTATGAFTYTPNANANGADSFTFKVNDGLLDSNTATVNVTVNPVNDAPVASNGTANTTVGAPVNGPLSASDVDGNPLTFSIVTNGSKGTAVVTNTATGAYTYTPGAGNSGTDTFTFHAGDGVTFSNTATVTITISSGGNQPPVANNSTLTTAEDRSASGTLTGSDAESKKLTFSIVSNGAKGTASITNASTGRFTYTPAANANGSDTFTFRVNDGQLNSNIATVSVTITPVNDAPVASSSA